ncbi:hypothetical protein BDY19DRAFT_909521 [Irpex rosettiformis]|uniref:Uncharacterized protein n=1 Tax=Irpex rosettiformis TaxID=378272 RepID=A0ACB8TSK5_9APHY|nr:hypothetical protein BDY19DRAFT_909521 [Irpex rosettiformis]
MVQLDITPAANRKRKRVSNRHNVIAVSLGLSEVMRVGGIGMHAANRAGAERSNERSTSALNLRLETAEGTRMLQRGSVVNGSLDLTKEWSASVMSIIFVIILPRYECVPQRVDAFEPRKSGTWMTPHMKIWGSGEYDVVLDPMAIEWVPS